MASKLTLISKALRNQQRPSVQRGFTLVEVMITVAIIAILASIALPAYQNSVLKAGRSDGKASLLSMSQFMERYFTTNSAYNNTACTGTFPTASGEGKYTLSLTTITANTFTITATPVGSQVSDICDDLSITNTGARGFTGSSGTSALCW